MIIDANTYVGHWPFRELRDNTVQGLAGRAQRHGITHMLVASLDALFYKDALRGNLRLLEDIAACGGAVKFLPFAVINPTYAMWEKDMANAVRKFGFAGIELSPLYHGYGMGSWQNGEELRDPLGEALDLAAELGVPVRLNGFFENFRNRHHMDAPGMMDLPALADTLLAHPKTAVIVNAVVPQQMGALRREGIAKRENLFFDMTGMEAILYDVYGDGITYAGLQHMCFGSLSPLMYAETSLVKAMFLPKAAQEKVLYQNLAPVFGLG